MYGKASGKKEKKKVLPLFSFKEIFKEEFPDTPILEKASEDIFVPDFADWQDTFKTMKADEAQTAMNLLVKHKEKHEKLDLSSFDIIICTTTMLKKLWKRTKRRKTNDNKWVNPWASFNIAGKQTSWHKTQEQWMQWSVTEADEDYYFESQLPLDFVVVIDDICSMDTGLWVNPTKYELQMLIKKENEYDVFNDTIVEEIERTTNIYDKTDVDWLKTNHIQFLNRKKKIMPEAGIEKYSVCVKKPHALSIINTNYKTIFTCAEHLQVQEIEVLLKHKKLDYSISDLTELQPVTNLLLIPSTITRADNDGQLLPIINYIKRKHQLTDELEFIADGVGSLYNLMNSKGLNHLRESNIVFKCSHLHQNQINALLTKRKIEVEATKGNTVLNGYTVQLEKTIGDINQIFGRAGGWRDSGKFIVGIIERNLYQNAVKKLMYDPKPENIPNWVLELQSILKDTNGWFNQQKYSELQFVADCNIKKLHGATEYKRVLRIYTAIVNNFEDNYKRFQVLKEFKTALNNVIGVINNVHHVTEDTVWNHDELQLFKEKDLAKNGIDINTVGKVLKSLGIVRKRIQEKKERTSYFLLSKKIKEGLLVLENELKMGMI